MPAALPFGAHDCHQEIQEQMSAQQDRTRQGEDVDNVGVAPWCVPQEWCGEGEAATKQVRPERCEAGVEQGTEHRQAASQGDGLPQHSSGGGGAGGPPGPGQQDGDGPGQQQCEHCQGNWGADHMDSVVVEEATHGVGYFGADASDGAFEDSYPVIGRSEHLVHEIRHVLFAGGGRAD